MKPFIKVNDNEVLGTKGNITYARLNKDSRMNTIQVFIKDNRDVIFNLSDGGQELWNYLTHSDRCVELTLEFRNTTKKLQKPKIFDYDEIKTTLKLRYRNLEIINMGKYILIDYSDEIFRWVIQYYKYPNRISVYKDNSIKILK